MFTAEQTTRVGQRPLPLLFPVLLLGLAFAVGTFSESLYRGYARSEDSVQFSWLYADGFDLGYLGRADPAGSEAVVAAKLWVFVYREGALRVGTPRSAAAGEDDRIVRVGPTVSPAELTALAKRASRQHPEAVVAMAMEWDTPAGDVQEAIAALRAGGVHRIALASR